MNNTQEALREREAHKTRAQEHKTQETNTEHARKVGRKDKRVDIGLDSQHITLTKVKVVTSHYLMWIDCRKVKGNVKLFMMLKLAKVPSYDGRV
jgi:hypothetical protein